MTKKPEAPIAATRVDYTEPIGARGFFDPKLPPPETPPITDFELGVLYELLLQVEHKSGANTDDSEAGRRLNAYLRPRLRAILDEVRLHRELLAESERVPETPA